MEALKTEYMNQTEAQIRRRESAKRAIMEALLSGRHISLKNSAEFGVSEMHTQICVIRRELENRHVPVTMSDRWTTDENGVRFKEYWIEQHN